MRKATPVNIIVYYPKTEKGRREIARRLAVFQASKVTAYLEKLNCPNWQKIESIDAVIKGLKQGSKIERDNACVNRNQSMKSANGW